MLLVAPYLTCIYYGKRFILSVIPLSSQNIPGELDFVRVLLATTEQEQNKNRTRTEQEQNRTEQQEQNKNTHKRQSDRWRDFMVSLCGGS